LTLDGVREEAIEAIFAVAHVEVDAWVEASVDVAFAALPRALVDSKVLLRT
jgi:hypothetical protein